MTKVCTKCGLEKPKDLFAWKHKAKGYLKAWCKSCDSERVGEWLKTPNGREASRQKDAKREASGERKEHHRHKAMRTKYGLEPHEFEGLLEAQGSKCVICSDHLAVSKGKYAIDHNHDTGSVRGVLCVPCNAAIGLLKDNPKIIDAASAYLRERGHYG